MLDKKRHVQHFPVRCVLIIKEQTERRAPLTLDNFLCAPEDFLSAVSEKINKGSVLLSWARAAACCF